MVKLKRCYEPASRRDIAPSHELRKWFGHDPKRWFSSHDVEHNNAVRRLHGRERLPTAEP
ncbi:MAG TPA: hypothetical protein VN947_29620 [Polyangia bacterium]|nr:hypothetical protein [Polyangia bacterium]